MKLWLVWLLIRGAVLALMDVAFIHDAETAIAFWVAFSALDAESTIEQSARARERRAAFRGVLR